MSLRMCRPIYRLGVTLFWIGILLTGIGLVIGLFGRGWTAGRNRRIVTLGRRVACSQER